jgi:hypothetical protein
MLLCFELGFGLDDTENGRAVAAAKAESTAKENAPSCAQLHPTANTAQIISPSQAANPSRDA